MTPYTPLRSIIEVMRTGSVSLAASRLGLTQPAVSGHIKVTEAAVGHALFDRVARGMLPTRLGLAFVQATGEAMDGLDVAYQGFLARVGPVMGMVRLIGPAPFLGARLGPALAALQARGLQVQVETGGQAVIYDRLLAGAADLAITASRPVSTEIGWQMVAEERLIPVAAPGFGHDMTQAPMAYDADQPLIRQVMAAEGLPLPQPAILIDDLSMLRQMAIAGLGWTVLPDYMLTDALLSGTLIALKTTAPAPINALHLAWLKSAMRTPRVALARQVLLETLTPDAEKNAIPTNP
jgi:DNA-binding transcriptional LysR family regulator